MPRKLGRTCNVCKTFMEGGEAEFIKHGLEHHPNHFYRASHGRHEFKEKNYFCPIDNTWHEARKWMSRSIPKTGPNAMTNEEYFKKYGQQYMPKEWEANTNDPVYGDAKSKNTCLECDKPVKFDEQHWQYPVFCANSKCNVNWHNRNHGRSDRAKATVVDLKKENPLFCLNPTQILYWTNKGFSEDEAKELIKERQAVGTLAKFIERAGGDVEKGTERWLERQRKWLQTRVDRGSFSGVSDVSNRMFVEIAKLVPDIRYGNDEVVIKLKHKAYRVDCVRRSVKKIIEFNGDYWHGNPTKYGPDDLICKKVPVREKWEKDASRKSALEAAGFRVLVIWESEFTTNPESIINKCVEFLNA